MNLRAFIAILLCKTLRLISRVLHRGGTAMPGRFALKVCPDLLERLAGNVKSVAITGTNGKTTSSRMVEEAFAEAKMSFFANRSGANLLSGITTEFVMNCTLTGKMKKEYAVIECDEAAAVKVFPQLKPKVIVVTNLFRDQLDRYGEVTHTLENIRTAIKPIPEAVLCLNADCSLTSSLALDLPNRAVWFGMAKDAVKSAEMSTLSDASHCIRCKTLYEYDFVSYDHLGHFRCPKCGYARHDTQCTVTSVVEQRPESSTVMIELDGTPYLAEINLPALYNIYNAAGALAACTEMGIDPKISIEALRFFKCGFGRMEQFRLGGGGTKMMLVKNPAGCNQVISFLENVKEKFILVICLNDRGADGTDISWIWDAEFEKMNSYAGYIDRIIVSGDRAEDMRLRVKYAGIPEENIQLEKSYEKIVSFAEAQDKPVFMMPTYTAMLELRRCVIKHCGGTEFWE